MRVSVDERDNGYATFVKHGAYDANWRVFLDGEEVHDVITADSDKGYLMTTAKDKGGYIMIRNESVVKEVRRGKIRIEYGE